MTDTDPTGHPGALKLLAGIISRATRPPEPMSVSEWVSRHIVLVDGPLAGQLWSLDKTPYLAEIADALDPADPCTLVTIRKSQQTGASILALAWTIFIADRAPANVLYGVPGIDALGTISGQKLQPLIDAFERRSQRRVFHPVTARSGTGSTTYEKKPVKGGVVFLANANTKTDLSLNTMKYGIKDEVSKWSVIQTKEGSADPENLFFGRFTAFRATRDYKILEISTPEVDTGDDTGETEGHCRIDRSFKKSDRRYWHVPCPQCEELFVHEADGIRYDVDHPERTHYPCPHCGYPITDLDRPAMIRKGRWVATATGEPGHRGYHVDSFISLLVDYRSMAEDYRASLKSETAAKDFANLVLGLPYRFRGDAPDHMRLMERREDYARRTVPRDVLILTMMVDVQHSGLYVEVVGWTPDRRSYTVDVDFIDGDTTDHRIGAWALLSRFVQRTYPDAWGNHRRVDAIGVDAGDGGRANQVLSWARSTPSAMALKGEDGWARPAISSQAKLVDIDLDGRTDKHGALLWKTGTWSLKAEFYAQLRKSIMPDGSHQPGYCHFGRWLDEDYFKQITSEYLENIISRGQVTGRRWARRGPNHFLDCRIGNMAVAEHLGLSGMTEADWQTLARLRQVPADAIASDLFTPAPLSVLAREAPASSPSSPPPPPPPPSSPHRDDDDWFGSVHDLEF